MNTLNVGEALRFGWATFKARPWFFIGSFLVISILSNVSAQWDDAKWEDVTAGTGGALVIVWLALMVVQTLAKMGGNVFLLKAHDAPQVVVFKDLWAPHPFWRYLGALVLKGAVIALPLLVVVLAAFVSGPSMLGLFILLGIPAVIWLIVASVRLMFVELIVMEKKLMPIEALKESFRITEGAFWQLVLLMLAFAGVMILGLLALVVGILVAIPVTMFAYAHVYRALQGAHQSGSQN